MAGTLNTKLDIMVAANLNELWYSGEEAQTNTKSPVPGRIAAALSSRLGKYDAD